MFLCPQAPNFSKKCPPKRRVIATKLNLRQKCVFHLFYCFSSFFFVFRRFSLFFNVFHRFSTFSSFCFVFHRFSSSQIYFHSEMNQLLKTTSAEISIIYSTKLCMFNTRSLLFVFWKLCLSAFSHIKILRAAANETCVLQINFVVFWGAH